MKQKKQETRPAGARLSAPPPSGLQSLIDAAVSAAKSSGGTLSITTGLTAYLSSALELLNASTGAIFLLDAHDPSWIEAKARKWDEQNEAKIAFRIDGTGIISHIARANIEFMRGYPTSSNGQDINSTIGRFGSRAEIDAFCSEQLGGTRDKRKLESLLVVPIITGRDFLGTIDVGSSKKNAFSASDEQALSLFASLIGAYVWAMRERNKLIHLFGKKDKNELMRSLVEEIPKDVHGIGCSIFVQTGKRTLTLMATSEFRRLSESQLITYEAGEGFTGWVMESGRALRIRAGLKCRTEHLEDQWREAGVRWQGKHDNLEPQTREYYESRPFLAVPIRSNDGKLCGVIRIPDRIRDSFSDDDERVVQMYADFLGFSLSPQSASLNNKGRGKPRIFLGHGRSPNGTSLVKHHLERLGCDVDTYEANEKSGHYSFDIVHKQMQASDAVVILYTGDDQLSTGERIGRRNVAHELGLAQGTLGPNKTILLLEDNVEKPTNVSGMQHISFPANDLARCFQTLVTHLERAGILPSG